MDPNPDYDASDEIEYFFNWLPWALRGVYPRPHIRRYRLLTSGISSWEPSISKSTIRSH